MKHCRKLFLFSALIILIPWIPADSATTEVEKCISCHDKTYNKSLHNIYIHRPFLDKKCLTCHVEGNTSFSVSNGQDSSQRTRPKITWLQKHYEPARSHFFLVPSLKVDNTLFVQKKGNNGRSTITSLTLPPLEQLPQLSNDNKQPEISDILFHGVKRGILYSAIISWKTDKPADGRIHYGIGTFNHKSNLDHQLKTHHTISISPVTPGKTYNYTVISQDIHGNRTISQPLSFSTKTLGLINPPPEDSPIGQAPFQEGLSHQLLAVGDQYFITITAHQSTYMHIGSHRNLSPRISMPANAGDQTVPAEHTPMKNTTDTNITTCLVCHKDYQSDSSHPINVRPKRGMTFPDDYPLNDDGRMHCMTCHDSHASNNEARIRRPSKQELCTGCHKNYG